MVHVKRTVGPADQVVRKSLLLSWKTVDFIQIRSSSNPMWMVGPHVLEYLLLAFRVHSKVLASISFLSFLQNSRLSFSFARLYSFPGKPTLAELILWAFLSLCNPIRKVPQTFFTCYFCILRPTKIHSSKHRHVSFSMCCKLLSCGFILRENPTVLNVVKLYAV